MNVPTPKELALSKVVKLHPATVDKAVEESYPEPRPEPLYGFSKKPYEFKARGPRKAEIRDEVRFEVREEVLELAMKMADGDMGRLELCPDGGVIIWNHRRDGHYRPVHKTLPPRDKAKLWDEMRKTKVEIAPEKNRMDWYPSAGQGFDTPASPSYFEEAPDLPLSDEPAPARKVRKAHSGGKKKGDPKTKVTPAQSAELYAAYKAKEMNVEELAEMYGISKATVFRHVAAQKAAQPQEEKSD